MQELDSCINSDQGHSSNEEFGRHSNTKGKTECTLCSAQCESVVHVLWKCSTCRENFREVLRGLIGNGFEKLVCACK